MLYDDRENVAAGAKFVDADMIGCPVRLVISKRTGEQVEWKRRSEAESKLVTWDEIEAWATQPEPTHKAP